jgi:hypothetical protein
MTVIGLVVPDRGSVPFVFHVSLCLSYFPLSFMFPFVFHVPFVFNVSLCLSCFPLSFMFPFVFHVSLSFMFPFVFHIPLYLSCSPLFFMLPFVFHVPFCLSCSSLSSPSFAHMSLILPRLRMVREVTDYQLQYEGEFHDQGNNVEKKYY